MPDFRPVTQAQYQRICDELDLAPQNRPRLEFRTELSQLSRRLAGTYMPAMHTLLLPAGKETLDFVIAHELCHVVAIRVIGYPGHHGAPFLALLHLVCLNYFSGYRGDVIPATVRTEWPRLTPRRWRQREIDAAEQVAARVQAELNPNGATRPSIEAIASSLKTHFADRVGHNVSWLQTWLDRASTQRGNWLGYLFPCAAALMFLSWFLANNAFTKAVGTTLFSVSLFVFIGVVVLTMVVSFGQRLANLVQDLRGWVKRRFGGKRDARKSS